MFSLFFQGGPVMLCLFLCSLAGTYIIIHKLIFFKLNRIQSQTVLNDVKTMIQEKGPNDAFQLLRQDHRIPYRSLGYAIPLSSRQRDEVRDGIHDITNNEIPKLERFLPILTSLITICPILGLLGTVVGLIDIFGVLGQGDIGNYSALSSGISTALISTVTGLSISIPFILFNHFFSHKISMYLLTLEKITADIVAFCKDQAKETVS